MQAHTSQKCDNRAEHVVATPRVPVSKRKETVKNPCYKLRLLWGKHATHKTILAIYGEQLFPQGKKNTFKEY